VSRDLDVVVVGAGLAGLTAAREVIRGGARAIVLEASSRVGGRLVRQEVAGVTVDGGGAWVGPTQDRVLAMIGELGLETMPQWTRGRNLMRTAGRTRARAGRLPPVPLPALVDLAIGQWRLDRLARRASSEATWKELDESTLDSWMTRHLHTGAARAVVTIAAAATTGSGPEDLSLLAFVQHIRAAGGVEQLTGVEGAAQDRRIAGGAVTLCERLADGMRGAVRLGADVRAVLQDEDGVSVRTGGEALRADRVVVALDPALCRRIDFGPELPRDRGFLHQGWEMGTGFKFHVAYSSPFWRESGLSGQLLADDGLVRLTFDATPEGPEGSPGVGVIVGFIGEAFSDDPQLLDPAAFDLRRRKIVDELAAAFGPPGSSPVDYVEKDWRDEPNIEGCVPGVPPGVLGDAGADPYAQWRRVSWAGAGAASRWEGHMDGAIRSGERAASEVLADPVAARPPS
jgi:monoamine oxidase